MLLPTVPKKGERITAAWAASVVAWIRRFADLLNVQGDGGLEVVGGTLRSVRSPSGLILCRIGPGGFTARVKDSPTPGTDTLGTGTVRRYLTDGLTVTLGDEEPASNSYHALFTGDRDGWFTPFGGRLSLVTRHCSDG